MHLLAHNGIDHATQMEGSMHSSQQSLLLILLVTAGIIGIVVVAIYLLHKRTSVKVAEEEREE